MLEIHHLTKWEYDFDFCADQARLCRYYFYSQQNCVQNWHPLHHTELQVIHPYYYRYLLQLSMKNGSSDWKLVDDLKQMKSEQTLENKKRQTKLLFAYLTFAVCINNKQYCELFDCWNLNALG